MQLKSLALSIVFYASFNPSPVQACHIYSIWHYKHHQSCRHKIPQETVQVLVPRSMPDTNWSIEIIKPPPDEQLEDKRDNAMNKLKELMK